MAVRAYQGGDQRFLDACKAAKIAPTVRQWKKWQRRKGVAWTTHKLQVPA